LPLVNLVIYLLDVIRLLFYIKLRKVSL
jgi:hypothetical protein